jgi:hypothetical protein
MSLPGTRTVFACAVVVLITGCRMGAPIHVWQPPQLESTVGKSVAVSEVVGPESVARQIEENLIQAAPRDSGRITTLVESNSLQSKSPIQLVSGDDSEPNDVALAAVARSEAIDYVLRGEILEDRSPGKMSDRLTVSWRLTELAHNRSAGGRPVVVDAESAIDHYPDLAILTDPDAILAAAASRDTFRLITPWIDRQRAQLAIPYFLPGSEEVRRGNAAALATRWSDAEEIWMDVMQNHPTQVAAVHNLSLAAVAAQDFSRAKQLARRAVRLQPTSLHKQTLVWVEVKQREYHEAFGLSDPPEGWFVTRD